MLTETEVTTKWCPMARMVTGRISTDGSSEHNSDQTAYNRVVDGPKWAFPQGGCCIGSGCMMWRWHEPWTSSTEEGQGGDLVLRLARKPGEPKRGYCGLAGAL